MAKENIEQSILLSIQEITSILVNKNAKLIQNEGLSNQQWLILLYLSKNPNLPYFERTSHDEAMIASELAEAMYVTRANITNLLLVLINKKLIKQSEDVADRRIKRLLLTKKGQKLIDNPGLNKKIFNEAFFLGISTEDKQHLQKSLKIIATNIIYDRKN